MDQRPSSERIRERSNYQGPMKWFGLIMALVFVCLAAYIYFDPKIGSAIDPGQKNILAGMLFIYGMYRGWRAWSMYAE